MTSDIAAILAIDGIATGAVYALVAIGTVLIFTVTRVIFIPFGDIAAFTALTLAALDAKRFPGTGALVVILACLATLIEIISLVRSGELRLLPARCPSISCFRSPWSVQPGSSCAWTRRLPSGSCSR
ncbi:hypothetical protein ACQ5SK_38050 [Bradyrhizobium japonicum]